MEGDEMQRLKDELEVLRQENLDLQQQMGRGKSRREMWPVILLSPVVMMIFCENHQLSSA